MHCIRVSLATICLLSVLALAVPAVAGPFDGQWILSTQSNRSNCGGGANELTVSDGRISGEVVGSNGVYTARGTISESGKVKFNLDAGYVLFKGKAEGGNASGSWNAGHCFGKFTMIRK